MKSDLAALPVLILDCQTTGANPSKGHLLEIAWAVTHAGQKPEPTAMLVKLPQGETLPRRITTLTGIDRDVMKAAQDPSIVWEELEKTIDHMQKNRENTVPTVIHFARFEEPFLRALHGEQASPNSPFPFDLICTHKIAQALIPDLPRRGLRALSGYFGRVLGEHKRAKDHVLGTAVVWEELIKLLAEKAEVSDLVELRAWFEKQSGLPQKKRKGPRAYPIERKLRLSLPDKPGVYRMLAQGGTVLYVGKATSLKKRVNSYFQKRRHHKAERMLEMLSQVRDVNVTITESPVEAALLETDEIKELAPPYNKALKNTDDRAWFATLDGSQLDSMADDVHPIGPLPARNSIEVLGYLAALLARPQDIRDPSSQLQVPIFLFGNGLDAQCLTSGVRLFADRHGLKPTKTPKLGPLLRLGAQLWRLELDRDDEELPDEEETDEDIDWVWDPEAVASYFEMSVRHEARLIRRGHLLCALSESVIAFCPKGHSEFRELTIEGGAITKSRSVKSEESLAEPPEQARMSRQRQNSFDGATYDRIRVLSTEIKRLIVEKVPVTVRLGGGKYWSRSSLKRRLRWI